MGVSMVGRFDERFLDEIKSRLRPSDVIGRTVKLRKQGREYVGLSPFTKEKTPVVLRQRRQGPVLRLLVGQDRRPDHLPAGDRAAVLHRGRRAAGGRGRACRCRRVDPRAVEEEKKRQGLADWLELAAQWFEAELRRPAGPRGARLSGKARPAGEGVGAVPPGLLAAGPHGAEGLPGRQGRAAGRAGRDRPADRAGGRRRALRPLPRPDHLPDRRRARTDHLVRRPGDGSAGPRQVPERPGDARSSTRATSSTACSEARKILAAAPAGEAPPLVVVEGYMDVIACQRGGIPAVAPMGTALTEEQMEMLWRHHPEPTLCFDGDRAGRQAAARGIDRALPLLKPGRSFQFAIVEGGKDPDDVLREQGPAALKAQLVQDHALRRGAVHPRARRRAAGHARAAHRAEGAGCASSRPPSPTRTWPRPTRKTCSAATSSSGRRRRRSTRWAAPAASWPARRWDKDKNGISQAGATPRGQGRQRAPAPLAPAAGRRPGLAAVRDPSVIDDTIELVGAHGFGDEKLDGLAQRARAPALRGRRAWSSTWSLRRLQAAGFGPALLAKLEQDAGRAGVSAPFLAGHRRARPRPLAPGLRPADAAGGPGARRRGRRPRPRPRPRLLDPDQPEGRARPPAQAAQQRLGQPRGRATRSCRTEAPLHEARPARRLDTAASTPSGRCGFSALLTDIDLGRREISGAPFLPEN